MRAGFVSELLAGLFADGTLKPDHRVLAVCAGDGDRRVLEEAGFTDVTLTNIEVDEVHIRPEWGNTTGGIARWERQDAHALTYPDDSFDFAFVSESLHHCHSPHQALTEMLRVAKVGVIVVESRDSLATRLAQRMGLSGAYETNAVLRSTRTRGGQDYGPVPNFVYRWTEREFVKTVLSFDPGHKWTFAYRYWMKVPHRLLARTRRVAGAVGWVLTRVAPRQCNTFAMVALRGEVQSWLEPTEGGLRLREELPRPGEGSGEGSVLARTGRLAWVSFAVRAPRTRRFLPETRRSPLPPEVRGGERYGGTMSEIATEVLSQASIQSLLERYGFDGTQHRLVGIEQTRKVDHNDVNVVCECGWMAGPIREENDVKSTALALSLHAEHVAEHEPRHFWASQSSPPTATRDGDIWHILP